MRERQESEEQESKSEFKHKFEWHFEKKLHFKLERIAKGIRPIVLLLHADFVGRCASIAKNIDRATLANDLANTAKVHRRKNSRPQQTIILNEQKPGVKQFGMILLSASSKRSAI